MISRRNVMKISKLLKITGVLSIVVIIVTVASLFRLNASIIEERHAKETQTEIDHLSKSLKSAQGD
jgi:CHASE3 domain sensor protein